MIQMAFFVCCGMTQFFFFTLEIAEMKYSGFQSFTTGVITYFSDGWNYMDSTVPFFYFLQTYLNILEMSRIKNKYSAPRFWYEMVTIIVLLLSATKFLQLIRYNEAFCFLVEMLIQVSKDIYPFLIVFFTFCAVFVLVTHILEAHYPEDDYDFLDNQPLMITMLQTFRNSIGDIRVGKYGKWIDA